MEKVRQLQSDQSQPYLIPVEDDWDDWFEEEAETDDVMARREKSG